MSPSTPELRLVLLTALMSACGGAGDSALDDSAAGAWEDHDGDGYVDGPDCDDDDPSSYPGGTEYCDGADNDCDGVVDDGALDTQSWYADADGDGYGNPLEHQFSCRQPSGYVGDARDCDDGDDSVHPDADDVGNGIDDDCDGTVDEGGSGSGGGAEVSYGELDLSTAADWWTGGSSGSGAGTALAGGHDITGDGTADLLLGAPGANTGGEFYFLRGEDLTLATGQSLDTASYSGGIGWSSPTAGDRMGASLAMLRDVEGDGTPDFAVGSPGVDDNAEDTGTVILWFSSIDAYYHVNTSASGAELGAVADGRDTDNDGLSDILVGAPGMSSSQTEQGFAELLLGSRSQMVTVGAYWLGSSPYDKLGSSLGSAGDLDGDGFDELVIAGTGYPAGGSSGSAWVVMGTRSWPGGQMDIADSDHQLMGTSSGDLAGSALAGGEDFDGDGYDDLVVAAPGASGGAGTTYLWKGESNWGDWGRFCSLEGAQLRLTGDRRGDAAGSSVALLDDFDGDGVADLAVGAPAHGSGAQGTVYLMLGDSGWSGTHSLNEADISWHGEAPGDALGSAVANAGDVDGDGRSDLLVGAPAADHAGTNAGAVHLFLGF
jgi:hypothetical protein